jgi:hypothetical protein
MIDALKRGATPATPMYTYITNLPPGWGVTAAGAGGAAKLGLGGRLQSILTNVFKFGVTLFAAEMASTAISTGINRAFSVTDDKRLTAVTGASNIIGNVGSFTAGGAMVGGLPGALIGLIVGTIKSIVEITGMHKHTKETKKLQKAHEEAAEAAKKHAEAEQAKIKAKQVSAINENIMTTLGGFVSDLSGAGEPELIRQLNSYLDQLKKMKKSFAMTDFGNNLFAQFKEEIESSKTEAWSVYHVIDYIEDEMELLKVETETWKDKINETKEKINEIKDELELVGDKINILSKPRFEGQLGFEQRMRDYEYFLKEENFRAITGMDPIDFINQVANMTNEELRELLSTYESVNDELDNTANEYDAWKESMNEAIRDLISNHKHHQVILYYLLVFLVHH